MGEGVGGCFSLLVPVSSYNITLETRVQRTWLRRTNQAVGQPFDVTRTAVGQSRYILLLLASSALSCSGVYLTKLRCLRPTALNRPLPEL